MMQKKGKRINFKIVHCSSEDPEYPVSELLHQTADAKGWQSRRFPHYPQTIVIQLIQISAINKIAILSHQSKIATKIEFQTKVNQSDDWKKLGRISMDSNANTNFQARQLKQANINDVSAKFVRLILRQNHVNGHNCFNQVGLISVSFYGQKLQKFAPIRQQFTPNQPNQKTANQIDTNTMNLMKQLQSRKRRAVEQQNYDLAKEIKDQIDRLKSISLQVASLESRKQEAIRRQNYEDAKLINQEIKRMRQGVQNQQYQPPREIRQPVYKPQPRREIEQPSSISPISYSRNVQKQPQIIQQKPRQQKNQKTKQSYYPKRQQDDDRPINVKNTNPYDQVDQQQQEERKQIQIQTLNKELYDECSQFFSILDQDVFKLIFSKDHSHRERGVQMVLQELKRTKNREEFIGACLYVVKNLIDDKIASVLVSAIGLISEMMKRLKPQSSSYNQPLLDYILQKMSDYLGHINQKIKSITEETYSSFPMYHLTNKEICFRALSTVGKREKPPKILTGRLKMINKLIQDYQLGKDYGQVIRYAVKYADDKNNDVRTAAIATLCSIAGQIGYNTLQPFLKNLRPPIIKSIQDKLDEAGNLEQPQNFDQRPIKQKTTQKAQQRQKQSQKNLQAGNQFIQIPKKVPSKNSQVNEDLMCQFCNRVDKRFIEEDFKDMHYFNACPMLIICSQCGQAVQVSVYTAHLVGQCANSNFYKKCPRCKEAVPQKNYKAHVEKKQCLSSKPMAVANRCPLCHLDIGPGQNGWKEHLVSQGCENNPRA